MVRNFDWSCPCWCLPTSSFDRNRTRIFYLGNKFPSRKTLLTTVRSYRHFLEMRPGKWGLGNNSEFHLPGGPNKNPGRLRRRPPRRGIARRGRVTHLQDVGRSRGGERYLAARGRKFRRKGGRLGVAVRSLEARIRTQTRSQTAEGGRVPDVRGIGPPGVSQRRARGGHTRVGAERSCAGTVEDGPATADLAQSPSGEGAPLRTQ